MYPKLFQYHGFFIPTYGVLVALAFLTGLWVTVRLARAAKLNTENVTNLAIYCALAGLVGAKLFMFLFNFNDYLAKPSILFSLSTLQAAGVYQGGLLLALVTAIFYMRRMHLPALLTLDVFAPGIAVGHAIGRLGCFAAGCCWGTECNLPWAVTFTRPDAQDLTGVPLNIPLHPTQLYDSFAEAIIFGLLYWRITKPHQDGQIFGLYLVLYSAARFGIEFLRNHEQSLILGLSLTQWISLGTLAGGFYLLLAARRKRHGQPTTVSTVSVH